jgi:hypothetical protein
MGFQDLRTMRNRPPAARGPGQPKAPAQPPSDLFGNDRAPAATSRDVVVPPAPKAARTGGLGGLRQMAEKSRKGDDDGTSEAQVSAPGGTPPQAPAAAPKTPVSRSGFMSSLKRMAEAEGGRDLGDAEPTFEQAAATDVATGEGNLERGEVLTLIGKIADLNHITEAWGLGAERQVMIDASLEMFERDPSEALAAHRAAYEGELKLHNFRAWWQQFGASQHEEARAAATDATRRPKP